MQVIAIQGWLGVGGFEAFGFGISGLGYRNLQFRVQGVYALKFGVWGVEVSVEGSEVQIWGHVEAEKTRTKLGRVNRRRTIYSGIIVVFIQSSTSDSGTVHLGAKSCWERFVLLRRRT